MPKNQDAEISEAIVEMTEALLGIATVEKEMLEKIKANLDKLLNSDYEQNKQYLEIAAREAMVSEQPITQADPALIESLNSITDGLNHKNLEILRLQQMLERMGIGLSGLSTKSRSLLRQQLDDLNKRNKLLREIHLELRKHPMMTGRMPKGVTLKDLRAMLEKLAVQIKSLNQANFDFKQKIKHRNLVDNAPPNLSRPKPGRSS